MAVLTPGVPVVSSEPTLSVEGLAPGTHRFRLVVEDDAGNQSVADERVVVVRAPAPVIEPRGFDITLPGTPLIDLAAEPARNEVWVLHGVVGAQTAAVSMVSLLRRGVVGTLAVQAGAREIAVSDKDLARAAVSNGGASTVSILDVRNRRVLTQVKVSPGPAGLAFQPGGTVLYVACSAATAAAARDSVDVISLDPTATAGPRVLTRIPLQRGAARVVFSPDGKRAFVNETGTGTVAMIDTAEHRVIDRFKVGGNETSAPSEVAVSAETFPLLVANPGTKNCSIIDAAGNVKDLDIGFPMHAAAIDASGGWLSGPAEAVALFVDLAGARLRKAEVAGSGAGPKSIVVSPGVAAGTAAGVVIASPGASAASVLLPRGRSLQAVARQTDAPVRAVLSADGALALFIGARSATLGALEVASVLPA